MKFIRRAQSRVRLDKVRNENIVAWFTLEPTNVQINDR
jgi:hypothetical protein